MHLLKQMQADRGANVSAVAIALLYVLLVIGGSAFGIWLLWKGVE